LKTIFLFQKICQFVAKSLNSGSKSAEDLHYAVTAWKSLGSCTGVQAKEAEVAAVSVKQPRMFEDESVYWLCDIYVNIMFAVWFFRFSQR